MVATAKVSLPVLIQCLLRHGGGEYERAGLLALHTCITEEAAKQPVQQVFSVPELI